MVLVVIRLVVSLFQALLAKVVAPYSLFHS